MHVVLVQNGNVIEDIVLRDTDAFESMSDDGRKFVAEGWVI